MIRWTEEDYENYLKRKKEDSNKKVALKTEKTEQEDKKPKKSKFRNEKTVIDGIVFDSKKEANYYKELQMLKKAGIVTDFELQPKFVLQPSYYKDGKKIQPITYKADFKVCYSDGRIEIVDTKGFETQVFKIKKKMLEYLYPDITLVII